MPWVFVVSAAGVRFPYKVAPVVPGALARHPQVGVLPLARDKHRALVLSLGGELDGIVPDARPPAVVTLSPGRPEKASEQQSSGPDPHGVDGR